MIYLYNNELEKIGVIGKDDLREFTTTEELNSQWIVEISYPFSLHKKEAEYIGFKDNNEFKLYKIINTSRSDDFIDINGVHVFFHDLKGKVIRDIRPSNKTALQVATEILKETDWQVFSTAKGLNSTNFYYISKLDAFYDLLEKWQCEFRLETYFDGDKFVKKIYLEDHISKDYGRWFEYGDKLLTVIAEENHSNVFTAFIGRGKGEETGDGFGRKIKFDEIAWSVANGDPINKPVGQDYVEIKEATKLYGYPDRKPRIAVVDFGDEEDKENLLKLTYEYALENSRPKLQLKATAVDDEKVELGEVCAIIRPNLDIRYKTRIFKIKTDRLSDLQEFEFGDKIVISRSDRIRAEQKTKEKEIQEIESRLEQALKNLDIDFNNEDGYNYDLKAGNKYNLPAGYYSFNKPIDENPTKVVYMGAGKVLIADEKGSDGSWKWKTAIDGSGISGSEIITHSITANKLAADVGQSLDLSSNKSITQTVDDRIDGLNKILSSGGYNLISNGKGNSTTGYALWGSSKMASDGKRIAVTRNTGTGFTGIQTTPFKIEKDKTYTIAFDFWSDTELNSLTYNYIMRKAPGNRRIENLNLENSLVENRYSLTFKAPWDEEEARVMLATSLAPGQELYFKNIMITESTIPSSYGPSEEELISESTNIIRKTYDGEIEGIKSDLSEQNQNLNNKADISELEEAETRLTKSIESNSLRIEQTSSSLTQTYERLRLDVDNNQVELEKLTAVIESGMDEDGNAYTDWIGDSKNRVRVGSDGITMYSDNTETMKLKDGVGYMDSLFVTNRLGLGNHTARKMGTKLTVIVPHEEGE